MASHFYLDDFPQSSEPLRESGLQGGSSHRGHRSLHRALRIPRTPETAAGRSAWIRRSSLGGATAPLGGFFFKTARRRPEQVPVEEAVRDLHVTPPTGARYRSRRAKRRESRNAGVEQPKAGAPSGPGQGQAAQQDSIVSQNEEAMFDLVLRSNQDELLQQLQRINGNQDATATFKMGLRPYRHT